MEFSRTEPAAAMTRERLFQPDDEILCRSPEADQFDFLLGHWKVVWEHLEDEDVAREQTLTLEVGRILHGYAVIALYQSADDDFELFSVRSYIPAKQRWEDWRIDNRTFQFTMMEGPVEADGALLTGGGTTPSQRIEWTELSADFFSWEQQSRVDGEWRPTLRCFGSRE